MSCESFGSKEHKVVVFWQDPSEGVGEPAIVIKQYSDVVQLQCGKSVINITVTEVEQFIKALRESRKP